MNSGFDLRITLASTGLAAALVAGACAMMEPKVEKPVPLPIGATWTQAMNDTGSFGKGSTAQSWKAVRDEVWQGRKVRVFESEQLTILADADTTKWVAFLSKGKPILSWDPPIGWEFPMEVGKTWSTKHRFTIHAAKRTVPLEVKFNVEAYEEVTVAAGTFKTFRIRTSDNLGNENVTWWSPEIGLFIKRIQTRTPKNASGPGTRETQLVSQSIN
jgi:hypothetical protein